MKKILALLLAISLMMLCASCTLTPTSVDGPGTADVEDDDWRDQPAAEKTGVTLNVYNWGEYIDDEVYEVNEAFTHLTGIEVNYKTFDSNEDMYALLSSGAADYDVVIPSDYMIGKMIDEGMLAPLDFNNIPNYKYIDEQYKNMAYDPENAYSVPYTWGVVGIFYNTQYVDEADLEQGWELLWDEKYSGKILMFNNPRDAFGITEALLGYSLNTTDEGELQACYEKLKAQKPLVQGYVMDQIYDRMINEDAYIAPYYNGDATIMMGEEGNENIDFFVPKQGTNIFVDAMCVLANSPHKAEAEAYINFMCDPDVALANAEYIGYSSPHTEARALLSEDIKNNPVYYPSEETLANTEVYITLPEETNRLMESLWLKVKQ
ncbi:MAG: spermidine/putrescine ABC transporter substrate-binding protein [Clostridia bacterium]|nr:spermidine/putrescine ABC transporter substrate-binding protein [Clostridia bacterium]